MMINIRINQTPLQVPSGLSILQAALKNNIYLPHLCAHPDLPPSEHSQSSQEIYQGTISYKHTTDNHTPGCELCLVQVEGIAAPVRACATIVKEGMAVATDTPELQSVRRDNLSRILALHPHSCVTCAQHEGCSLTQCSSNVAIAERCCPKFNRCELQKVAEYIGVKPETPRYQPPTPLPEVLEEPLYQRRYHLCISCTRCVRACRDLRGIDALGFVIHNGKVVVGSRRPTLKESGCKFCGACVEVCPTGALMDKNLKAADRALDLIPCQYTCPAQINVPEYVRQVKLGNEAQALAVIRESVPLPTVLGRVCFHPCESVCRRGEVNEPIAICALKRFSAESTIRDTRNEIPTSHITHPESPIAIIGSGPAGLTAAYYLVQAGYPVTVFESQPEPGGMMCYGIPAYRLPLDILKADINYLTAAGVQIKVNQTLGKEITLDSLRKDGFKAILITTGASLARKIKLTGLAQDKQHPDILWGIDFLRSVRQGKAPAVKPNVLVIGGGNVAIDVALTARRLGAKQVEMICLESAAEMPAHPWEIDQARVEGVKINCSWGPEEVMIDPTGKLQGIKFIKCTRVFDERKCFNPAFDKTSRQVHQPDQLILAIGQTADTAPLKSAGLDVLPNGALKIDEATLQTNLPGVFAAGESAHNPGSVINAIADGRKAAAAIAQYLGETLRTAQNAERTTPVNFGRDEGFAAWPREKMPERTVAERVKDFNQIELGYDKTCAGKEAGRCLQCDVRLKISPVTFPPRREEYQSFTETVITALPEKEGVYQLLDKEKNVITIKGALNLRASLQEQLASNKSTCYFIYELDPFYTKRESELIQQYLARHGKMPGGGDELDELF